MDLLGSSSVCVIKTVLQSLSKRSSIATLSFSPLGRSTWCGKRKIKTPSRGFVRLGQEPKKER